MFDILHINVLKKTGTCLSKASNIHYFVSIQSLSSTHYCDDEDMVIGVIINV